MRKTLEQMVKNSMYAMISIITFLFIWAMGVNLSDIKIVMPGPWEVIVDFVDSFYPSSWSLYYAYRIFYIV